MEQQYGWRSQHYFFFFGACCCFDFFLRYDVFFDIFDTLYKSMPQDIFLPILAPLWFSQSVTDHNILKPGRTTQRNEQRRATNATRPAIATSVQPRQNASEKQEVEFQKQGSETATIET